MNDFTNHVKRNTIFKHIKTLNVHDFQTISNKKSWLLNRGATKKNWKQIINFINNWKTANLSASFKYKSTTNRISWKFCLYQLTQTFSYLFQDLNEDEIKKFLCDWIIQRYLFNIRRRKNDDNSASDTIYKQNETKSQSRTTNNAFLNIIFSQKRSNWSLLFARIFMSLLNLRSSYKMSLQSRSYLSSTFLSIKVTLKSKSLKDLILHITNILKKHTLLQCESFLSMKKNFNNVLIQLEISLKKFKQLVQEDLNFSNDLKIEYEWNNCNLIMKKNRHLQAAVNYFRKYNNENEQFTMTDLNQLNANDWFNMHKNCICNVLTKSIEQININSLQSAESSQDQKRNRSSKKSKIDKLINDLLRQNLSDHNVSNDSEKNNPDEKRVKENTIEANFWKNQMQEVKLIIIKKISEPRLSIENIHVSKFQTSSQIMHDSELQFKSHLTHNLEPKVSKILTLFQKLTNFSKKSFFKHESAAILAVNFTFFKLKIFKTISKITNSLKKNFFKHESTATFAVNLTFFKLKIFKTISKIDDDVIELIDDDDESSTTQFSHDRYDRYNDLLKNVLLSKEEKMSLFKNEK